MGRTVSVDEARPLIELLANEPDFTIMMIDGQLVPPDATVPASWRDVRIKTPAGTLAIKRDGERVDIVGFGNDDALNAMQERVAAALRR
jgi:hypothetical protein